MFRSRAVWTASIILPLAFAWTPADAALPDIDFSGFGTAGFAVTDTGKAEFGRSQAQLTGVNDQGDVGLDSLMAVQATVHLNEMFSATAQTMVRRLFSTGFQLEVPVFFAKADLTRDLSVRVGRIQLPVFMISDYRQVGYSNTWLRPPVELYGMIPFDTNDGADMLYRTTLGPVDISAQAFYGKTDASISNGTTIQTRANWGVNVTATVGPLSVRAARNQSKFTSTSTAVNQLLVQIAAAGFPDLANRLNPTNVPYKFTDFGFSLEEPHFTLQGEYAKQTVGGFLASVDAEYLLAGYRIQKWTPYAMVARQKVTSARSDNTIPPVGPLLPLALAVNQLINSFEADQHTVSAGLRWDLHESLDLKVQVDRVSFQGNGLFINPLPGFHGPVTVGSMTLDFVF
jgi:predicted porin